MNIAIITAYGRDRAIGQGGDLPWGRALPADLAHFKHLTSGGCVIMGRKTFESIGRKPLPNRENIVISSTPTGAPKVLTALNLASALALARYDTFIIGGAQVYADALTCPDVTTLYATEVDAEFPEADTFFPPLDMSQWHEVSRQHHPANDANAYAFDFVEYRRAGRLTSSVS
ncbi:MAG: dihydrofolate reductase [Candidatus Saccharibacteria bacterium]|nr:dihydrofolate reductase [Candidatus Saccharibacteria bacterium]